MKANLTDLYKELKQILNNVNEMDCSVKGVSFNLKNENTTDVTLDDIYNLAVFINVKSGIILDDVVRIQSRMDEEDYMDRISDEGFEKELGGIDD